MSGTEHDGSWERGKVKAALKIPPDWLDVGERTVGIHTEHGENLEAADGRPLWVFQLEQFTKVSDSTYWAILDDGSIAGLNLTGDAIAAMFGRAQP